MKGRLPAAAAAAASPAPRVVLLLLPLPLHGPRLPLRFAATAAGWKERGEGEREDATMGPQARQAPPACGAHPAP